MNYTITIQPNQLLSETRIQAQNKGATFSAAYVGAYTYMHQTHIDEPSNFCDPLNYSQFAFHVGNFCSIGLNMQIICGRNHGITNVGTGAVGLLLADRGCEPVGYESKFNEKGAVTIMNDVWSGENVTIMAGVTVGNGSVIARNSHVVKDVPDYAIVGGNPAKVIGYRFTPQQIEKLKVIRWWNWPEAKIVENARMFTDDIDGFCDAFYDEALKQFRKEEVTKDADRYFCSVDYAEGFASYPHILEQFLDRFSAEEKELLLFFRNDIANYPIPEDLFKEICEIAGAISEEENVKCRITVETGDFDRAKEILLSSGHFLTNRTPNTVYFTELSRLHGIEAISGVDGFIQFEKTYNMIRVKEA